MEDALCASDAVEESPKGRLWRFAIRAAKRLIAESLSMMECRNCSSSVDKKSSKEPTGGSSGIVVRY